jgi:trehalose 6-phosphate phosphatase
MAPGIAAASMVPRESLRPPLFAPAGATIRNMTTVSEAVEATLQVLAARPSMLVTDIDGTLSRIVARPQEAYVSEYARDSLRRLANRLDAVAVITGREELTARRMVGVEDLIYVGSYALDESGSLTFALVRPALRLVEPRLGDFPCVDLELKQVSFALHYRNCDDPQAVRARLLALMAPIASRTETKLMEGKQVIEVAPEALPDKATALKGLLRDHEVRGAVFVGDDLADAAAFRALRSRREGAGVPGLAIAVVDDETPPEVRDAADIALHGVDDVERFLDHLADRLEDQA